MRKILSRLTAVIWFCFTAAALSAEEATFVVGGKAQSVREIGEKWSAADGFLQCEGVDNFLVAGKTLANGDFRIRARLSLAELNGTAASLVIGGNHFGFDGRGKKLFLEGPQFGQTRLIADGTEFITPGKPFQVEVVRSGDVLSLKIDGRQVHRAAYKLDPIGGIALRPWRSTMRVYAFSASGKPAPVTEAAVASIRQGYQQPPDTRKTADAVTVGGRKISLASPPEGLVVRRELGILTSEAIRGQVIHRSREIVWVPRATITPKGDLLVLFPHGRGRHYQGREMLALRSTDRGKTWKGPTVAFDASQSHHGFVPLIPHGSKRIYAFGTQPLPGRVGDRNKGLHENCPIGFRWSDDDGHTWSDVTLIRPANDPEFTGMSCVRMCETDAGTWLIGSHDGIWRGSKKAGVPVVTRQYVLRSEDKGKTWQLLPKKRPGGWFVEKYDRMDEGTLLSLGGGNVLLMTRTAEGHIWAARSGDDGKTWSDPAPTKLVHPDAPPMIFHLSDGRTLIAFIHNRYDPGRPHFEKAARNELWCSISKDEGRTWSQPRFFFAGATPGGHIHSCSYIDVVADKGRIHVFLGQDGRQLLYVHCDETDLADLPTVLGP